MEKRGLFPAIAWGAALAGLLLPLAPAVWIRFGIGPDFLPAWIRFGFSNACHQIPERSFFLFGEPFAVCARCYGVYAGYAAGTAAWFLFRGRRDLNAPRPAVFAACLAPAAADFCLAHLGLFDSSNGLRMITGLAAGAAVPFYLLPGLRELAAGGLTRPAESPRPLARGGGRT
jgi:uncharacterized membrane protein